MNAEIQTIVAITVVAVTALLLVRSVLKRRKAPGCGGGCGCDSKRPASKKHPDSA